MSFDIEEESLKEMTNLADNYLVISNKNQTKKSVQSMNNRFWARTVFFVVSLILFFFLH